ncbi:hypothetical protein LTS14_006972 [Recurvomyces mirabilis]|uniref:uncharacterized protein n=1 Tax=Recurvomyces mirabilis TaxID=574656 RepID=UPI002DDEC9C3|nr:hypothetical protein LTS14_006972 [Recurvomyces mirabilis]
MEDSLQTASGMLEPRSAKLADYRAADAQHHDSHTQILEQYVALIEEYKRLKSDYEEERDSRERYKQLARGQERNPFVLVLVDGDGYIFDDDLVSNGAEGGQRAAHLLDEAVKRSLRERGLENCRVMVRVYANMVGLSKVLSRSKLVGPERRSLAPFIANFTRSMEMFDFVDAGELKENADFKIRALFHQFVENAQCRHIFFAGCHDVGYINELTPYASSRERLTLIRHPAFHPEFKKLGLRIEEFSNIFRTTPLEGGYVHHATAVAQQNPSVTPSPFKKAAAYQSHDNDTGANSQQVCRFFQSGNCKYGDECRNLHIKSKPNGSTKPSYGGLEDVKQWRNSGTSTLPFGMNNLAKSDNDFMAGNASFMQTPKSTNKTSAPSTNGEVIDFAAILPDSIPENKIAVNKTDHRIDPYDGSYTAQDFAIFSSRTVKRKLCNLYHIAGYCAAGSECPYDHDPASEGVLNDLRHACRSAPCPRKGACRRAGCTQGHICQKKNCTKRGGKVGCKFNREFHAQSLRVVRFVDALALDARENNKDVEGSRASADGEASERDTTPWGGRSEVGDEGEAEGALLDSGNGEQVSLD